jgi:hypothetical protein
MVLIVTACEPRTPVASLKSEESLSAASNDVGSVTAESENTLSVMPDSQRASRIASTPSDWARYGPTERSLVRKEGGLDGRVKSVLTSDKFDDFLTAIERENANNSDAATRENVYREALEQTLSEIPGTSAPVRFTCGSNLCAGYLRGETGADWFNDWQADLMKDQLAPISTMVVKNVNLPDGSIQHRFLFTTSGPGGVRVRRGQ